MIQSSIDGRQSADFAALLESMNARSAFAAPAVPVMWEEEEDEDDDEEFADDDDDLDLGEEDDEDLFDDDDLDEDDEDFEDDE